MRYVAKRSVFWLKSIHYCCPILINIKINWQSLLDLPNTKFYENPFGRSWAVTCWPPDTVMQTGIFLQLIANVLQPTTCLHPYFTTLSHFHSPVCKDIPNLNFIHLTSYIHYSSTQVSIKILSILWSEVASGNSFLTMRSSEENLNWRECYQGNGIWDHGSLILNKWTS
jgi:hypothetical protein